jgi:hypothetical protein
MEWNGPLEMLFKSRKSAIAAFNARHAPIALFQAPRSITSIPAAHSKLLLFCSMFRLMQTAGAVLVQL